MQQIARILIIIGIITLIIGLFLYFSPKSFNIGKLPGDIIIKKKNFTFYFPIITSIILSVIITIIIFIINYFRK